LPILYGANPEQQERYLIPVVRGERLGAFALTEATGGSDPAGNMHTIARVCDGGWVIDGRKCFVSLGQVADHVVVFARTGGGITAFVVDRGTPGLSVVRVIPTMGSVAPAELDFTECRVPDANRIGEIGQGFVLAQRLLGRARMEIGARAVGACDRLLDLAIGYVGTRTSFGAPISEHGGVQWMLADCAIELDATRWMTYASAVRVDAGMDTRVRDSMVKVFASEALGRVADRVLQLFGGWGYAKDLPVERFYREARMWRIVEGPNEIHRWAIARALNRFGVAAIRPV
jgi:alkylation response protein AidB-like acyl-CoA dehydrogenase